ncbi:MAG: hypothetical protein EA399_14980 [Desulfovibrionales bacterium]|nr:MAG: hypothetical protein EA399_14980 [Desulfovibrionales bacterium]
MTNPIIIETNPDGSTVPFVEKSVRALGKNEEYLEEVIASHPELLELELIKNGILPKVFRQRELKNTLENTVVPDIILLFPTGDVVIVEVKLMDNPELRSRMAIAQIFDYASAFVDKQEDELARFFSKYGSAVPLWEHVVQELFPEVQDIENLAEQIKSRLQSGAVHLIIACDTAPVGLKRLIKGVAQQSALPFDLSLVEVKPFVRSGCDKGNVLFVAVKSLTTNIINRTVVTVRYEEGSVSRPSVSVLTTSPPDNNGATRFWTTEDVETEIEALGSPIVKKLFYLARTYSSGGRVISPGKTRKPVFGMYLEGTCSKGQPKSSQLFNQRLGDANLRIYLNMLENIVPTEVYEQFVMKLDALFPEVMSRGLREPLISLVDVETKFVEFEDCIRWLVEKSNSKC